MTATDTRQETTLVGFHAIYRDRSYSVKDLGHYLVLVAEAWHRCNGLGVFRLLGEEEFRPVEPQPDLRNLIIASLEITRLRIESPMDLVTSAQGGSVAVLTAYSIHVLVRVLRHPEQIGAWVPRLVAGWELGWREAANARMARHTIEREEKKVKNVEAVTAAVEIGDLLAATGIKPEAVTVFGAGEPPEELVAGE